MAGAWEIGQGLASFQSYGQTTGTTLLTTVTASGSTNTKGAYAQLTASTTSDTSGIIVSFNGFSTTANWVSADIAVGGAGSEIIVIPDIFFQVIVSNELIYFFPVVIKAGSRIAVRIQSPSANDVAQIGIITTDDSWGNPLGFSAVDVIGFVSGTTNGTSVDAGTSANTVGAWTQLIASSASDYAGLIIASSAAAAGAAANFQASIGIGAGGSEVVVINSYPLCVNVTSEVKPDASNFFMIPIKSGTRIAARLQCNLTVAGNRTLQIVVYGIRQ